MAGRSPRVLRRNPVRSEGSTSFSILVRVDLAQLVDPALHTHPRMRHPADSEIQARSDPRGRAPSGSHGDAGQALDRSSPRLARPLPRASSAGLALATASPRSREEQAIIDLALRQQLAVYAQERPRPRISPLENRLILSPILPYHEWLGERERGRSRPATLGRTDIENPRRSDWHSPHFRADEGRRMSIDDRHPFFSEAS